LKRTIKNVTIYLLIVLIAVCVYIFTSDDTNNTPAEAYEYGDMIASMEAGKIESLVIQPDDNDSNYYYEVKLKDGKEYTVVGPADTNIANQMRENGVEDVTFMTAKTSGQWLSILFSFLPILLLVGLMIFMMNKSQGGGNVMQFGKSRAKMQTDTAKKVTFKDVAGVDEVKEELAEIVDFLKAPKKYTSLGAKIPKGVLLFGPPGTGKTLLAKAVAGEAGTPFFTISGSDFVEMFVGVGASRVRDLFNDAKKNAPCIIFIDEIDAVGRQRGAGVGGGHDEREQTLNQLLVEMDGFDANEGIIVMAGTNRPDILDPALLRPGRFDRQIAVSAPDVKGREAILEVHSRNKPFADDVNLKILAKRTPGFTGADLANMLNEAALLAARQNKKKIEMEDCENAVERVIAGPEKKSRVINNKEKKLVSYHEAGHAVVSYYLPTADPLHKVSIIPRGMAGGYTLLLPEEDTNYVTKTKMLDQAVMFLGGRVAEQIVLGDISTGASNDLERATDMIRQMITKYGMTKELGPMTYGKDSGQVFLGRDLGHERNYSDAVAYAIDQEAKKLMEEAYQRATDILTEHIDKLHAVAEVLVNKETIEADEFYEIMDGVTKYKQLAEKADEENADAEENTAEEEQVVDNTNNDQPLNDAAGVGLKDGFYAYNGETLSRDEAAEQQTDKQ
jgi:cell division protease FtsH